MLDQCCNGYQCCGGGFGDVLLQINVICMLLFLIATAALVKHPDWFDAASVVTQSIAGR